MDEATTINVPLDAKAAIEDFLEQRKSGRSVSFALFCMLPSLGGAEKQAVCFDFEKNCWEMWNIKPTATDEMTPEPTEQPNG